MANMPTGREVRYIGKGKVIKLRMETPLLEGCFDAARDLRARFFVVPGAMNYALDRPSGWFVFDVTNPNPHNKHRATAVSGLGMVRPVKVFETETDDAAVMWALHHEGRS